jgi:hypothetical protein
VHPIEVQRAYERAEELRALDTTAIRELLGRSNRRRGAGLLRDLADYDPAPATETSLPAAGLCR